MKGRERKDKFMCRMDHHKVLMQCTKVHTCGVVCDVTPSLHTSLHLTPSLHTSLSSFTPFTLSLSPSLHTSHLPFTLPSHLTPSLHFALPFTHPPLSNAIILSSNIEFSHISNSIVPSMYDFPPSLLTPSLHPSSHFPLSLLTISLYPFPPSLLTPFLHPSLHLFFIPFHHPFTLYLHHSSHYTALGSPMCSCRVSIFYFLW